MSPKSENVVVQQVASVSGAALGALSSAVARLRSDKPLHPHGVVMSGVLHRIGTKELFGVPWVDEPGRDEVLVRFSRAVGLPQALPDVLGLSLRVSTDEGNADLLFATTGRRRLSRFILRARTEHGEWFSPHTYTTLLPYRTAVGAAVFAAEPTRDGHAIQLSVAHAFGEWKPFAMLMLDEAPTDADDRMVTFEPVLNPPPGFAVYDLVLRLRERAYAAARQARGVPTPA